MRREIELRPLLIIFLSFALGLSVTFGWWHLLALITLFWIFKQTDLRWMIGIACLVGVLLRPAFPDSMFLGKEPFKGEVKVSSVPLRYGDMILCEGDWQGHRVQLSFKRRLDISMGDRLLLGGLMSPPQEQMDGRGLYARVDVVGDVVQVQEGPGIWRVGLAVRRSFEDFLEKFGHPKVSGLIESLCFGGFSSLDRELSTDFQRTGTIHIVSVGGLHVLILAVAIAWGLGTLPIPRWAQVAFLLAILLVYAGASGLRPPIVRAVIMAACYYPAYLFRREPDALSAVSLAGILSLIVWRDSIYDIGFLLSYAAVFGLILFSTIDPVSNTASLWSWARQRAGELFKTSLVANLSTAPITSYVFGYFSIIGVVANLLVVPFVAIIIIAAMAGWLIGLVIPPVGVGILKIVAEPLTGWIIFVVDALGSFKWSAVPVPWYSPYLIPIPYLIALFVWRARYREP